MENKNIPYELSDYKLRKIFCLAGENQGWLNDNAVIASVSGGGDSIALLWLCRKFYAGKILAFHVNHGIRGSEADEDERFTANFAHELGCEFESVKINVPEQKLKGESLETSARRLRLRSICEFASKHEIKTVLLGHNRDDLAETVLFNILRGTGIRGSVGITETTEIDGVKFCRPLLEFRREFLREVLRARGLTWREDSTNNSSEYTRNFIRLKLFPIIEANINNSAIEHLASFGEEMRRARENEEELSRKILNEFREDKFILNRKKLKNYETYDLTLAVREIGREFGLKTLPRRRCLELAELVRKPENFIFQWNSKFTVKGYRGKIILTDERRKNNA